MKFYNMLVLCLMLHNFFNFHKDLCMHKDIDIMTWAHFPQYWPFLWEIHESLMDSPHKGQIVHTFDEFILLT